MAARTESRDGPSIGSDSFLDVISNLVGVLIVLIVLVGLRVKQAPVESFRRCLDRLLARRLAGAEAELARLGRLRDRLAAELRAVQQELATSRRAVADLQQRAQEAERQRLHDRQLAEQYRHALQEQERRLGRLRTAFMALQREVGRMKAKAASPRLLLCRFPLSRPADSEEVHLELRGGKVAFVNVPALLQQARTVARQSENELRRVGRVTRQTKPIGPFALEFTLLREQMPFPESLLYGPGSFRARMVRWQVVPVEPERGEPAGRAIEPGSRLRAVLDARPPDRYAITVWTYPDSFAAFRVLRDYLYDQGYSVAARPLPPDVPIAASLFGSRSFVQ